MRTGLLIISLFLFIAGCKSKDAVPGNVLPQKEMQAVLWDMMRADQFLADYVLNKDTSLKKKTESIKLYQQILAINGVTKEKFESSFTFYKSHPLLLKVIMDSIVNAVPEPGADTTRHDPIKDSLKTAVDSARVKDTARVLKKLKRLRSK
jgi:Domain of unknown function (DUF4296)